MDLSWPWMLRVVALEHKYQRNVKDKCFSLPVVAKDDLPAALVVEALALSRPHKVAHNLDIPALAQQLVQQRPDDGLHAAAENHNRHVVVLRPVVKVPEAGVELDVLQQNVDTLVQGRGDAIEHLAERVAEVDAAEERVGVALLALLGAVAQVVGHVIVGVGGGDGAVEVGEEDELGVGGHGRRVV